MRVTILETKSGSIIVDATSLDNDQGYINLESEKIEAGIEYTLRYDLYDKELVSNDDMPMLSRSSTNTRCKLPFITQELIIIDKRLLKHRLA
jgi:hypothetical protein